MITLPLLVGAAAVMLVLAALALIPSRAERDIRKRAAQLGIGIEDVPIRARQSLRQLTSEERPIWQKALVALGQNPEIPEAYRTAPLLLVLIVAGAAGVGMWAVGERFGRPGAPLGAVIAGTGALMFMFRREKNNYNALLLQQLPDAISLVLRAVRTGLPVTEAIRSIGTELPAPTGGEFDRVSQEVAIGVPIDDSIWNLYERTLIQEYAFLAVTVGLQAQAGGNLTETLANLADLVRKRVAMVVKVKAITAEARTSAAILIGLPFVVSLLLMVLQPDYVGELFTHPKAGGLQALFVILMTCGILTINTLIARATRD
ncbi:type II secretion system F family protein [Falsiroseomonas sp. HW251]|uniref:type II secretion system F family protein n=1 Tax=Falsiroseomonas sp. HW251 TaxID=3390998 RepID=UPI003D31F6FD